MLLVNYSLFWKPSKLIVAVRARLAKRSTIQQAIKISEERFKNHPNYRLDLVQESFTPRPGTPQDDSVILERIVTAYKKARTDQRRAAEAFNVSNEWLPIYERNLAVVMEALLSGNIGDLQCMYQNFFRDPCSTGLVGLPINMPKAFFGGNIKETHKKYVLSDVLHRYDLWKKRTNNAYGAESLASPLIGNPYGYTMDGVFIRSGADYHHYYAHAIKQLLGSSENPVVAELGAGFGGMAYYLLRDRSDITYVDFDLPEALALASYYLMKALPDHPVTLYGEADFSEAALHKPGIFLMPSFEIIKMPPKSVSVSFNSYSLAEMSPSTIHVYIEQITKMTKGSFLHVNHNRNAVLSADNFGVENHGFTLINRDLAGWTLGTNPDSDEFEYLYQSLPAKQN
jgi:putative sugar O-methyltransferase